MIVAHEAVVRGDEALAGAIGIVSKLIIGGVNRMTRALAGNYRVRSCITDREGRIGSGFRKRGIQKIEFEAFESVNILTKTEDMVEEAVLEHQYDDVFDSSWLRVTGSRASCIRFTFHHLRTIRTTCYLYYAS